jgi:hypothetical protein
LSFFISSHTHKFAPADPLFDKDESSRNPPPRQDGTLASYRPLYMPENARPGTVEFADKVRSVKAAAEYGPVMIGVAVCNSMFRVNSRNSVENPYYDPECSDAINHIVNVVAFHIEDLPAEGEGKSTQIDGKEWWERSSILVQNTWGSFGNHGQGWLRVDFTQKWSLGVVPLVRRPNVFKNPYLPSQRLTELRLGKSWYSSSAGAEFVTDARLPKVCIFDSVCALLSLVC